MISEKTLKNWCSALGLYREHAGALRSTDEPEAFDAMGVLLQLVDPDGWHLVSMSWQHTLARGSHYVSTDLLPHDVQAELARWPEWAKASTTTARRSSQGSWAAHAASLATCDELGPRALT